MGRSAPQLLATFALSALNLAQQPHARIEGQCCDTAERPVANCAITVERDGEVLAKTNCDATGFFVVSGLPAAEVVVRALAGNDVGAAALDLAAQESGFARLSLWPARTVRGSVKLADGTPVAGAWILAVPADAKQLGPFESCGRSGADGRYELAHVLAGPVTVRAFSPECAIFEGEVQGATDATLDCTLGGEPRRSIRFQLLGMSREQMQGARVHCMARTVVDELPCPLPLPLRCMRADDEGFCLLTGWPGSACIWSRCELADGTILAPIDLELHDPVLLLGFDARPDPARMLRGILVGEQGRPLPGKRFSVRAIHGDDIGLGTVSGVSGPDGTFAVRAPIGPRGRFALQVREPGLAVVHESGREIGARSCYVAGHSVNPHRIPVAAVPSLRLCAIDPAGNPVRGVEAVLFESGERHERLGRGTSDAVGRIELPGIDLTGITTVRITLSSPGGVAEFERKVADPSGDLGDIKLTPAAGLGGVVTDAAGKPVAGVRMTSVIWKPYAGGFHAEDWRTVLTGRDGRFFMAGLAAGPRHYAIGGADPSSRAVTLQAGERTEVEIVLR